MITMKEHSISKWRYTSPFQNAGCSEQFEKQFEIFKAHMYGSTVTGCKFDFGPKAFSVLTLHVLLVPVWVLPGFPEWTLN